MMKVAITLEQCWHRVPGGTASAAIGSVRALQRLDATAGHTPLDLVGVSARHRRFPPSPWLPPLPVRQLPLPRLALYEAWHQLRWPAVQRATGPVDVVHVTGMAMPPRSAPLVVTVNDLAFRHEPELFTTRGVSFFRRALELTARDADLIVCPSASTLAECREEGFDEDRLRVVPYGIDVVAATEDDVRRVTRRFGIDRRYVLWLGTIEPRKNVAGVLDAFLHADVGDALLVLAGPQGWNQDLRSALTRLGDRVRSTGFVSDDEKRALLAGADVFCFPSRREGFGLPVLEAMAQGTPVITSADTATAEILVDAEHTSPQGGLLVQPGDRASITAALGEVLGDPTRRAELGAQALARARAFSWSRSAELLAGVYAEAKDRS